MGIGQKMFYHNPIRNCLIMFLFTFFALRFYNSKLEYLRDRSFISSSFINSITEPKSILLYHTNKLDYFKAKNIKWIKSKMVQLLGHLFPTKCLEKSLSKHLFSFFFGISRKSSWNDLITTYRIDWAHIWLNLDK